MKMTRDELEFALSQYHDGSLPPLERSALDEILASNADAREILAEYARLDRLLRKTPAMPALNWDRLQGHLVERLGAAQAPIRTLKIGSWARWTGAGIAVAAVLLLIFRSSLRNEPTLVAPLAQHIEVHINAPTESNPALARVDVEIGPSPQVAAAEWRYNDAFTARPSRIVIAVSPEDGQDGGSPAPF